MYFGVVDGLRAYGGFGYEPGWIEIRDDTSASLLPVGQLRLVESSIDCERLMSR